MRLKKLAPLVPMVGFCAVSFLSSSAMANQHEWWAVNCATSKCLEATGEGGLVKLSECNLRQVAEQWIVDRPLKHNISNEYFKNTCLEMINGIAGFDVMTNRCDKPKSPAPNKAQQWKAPKLGDVGQIVNAKFANCITVAKNGLTVIGEQCSKAHDPLQTWYWVNVGHAGKCPVGISGDSSTKATKARYPFCSFKPPSICTKDKNECGHPSYCACPALYTYNPATGKCDLLFKERSQKNEIEIVFPKCSIDPVGKCTADINICGNPSYCTCPSRPVPYKYNQATKKCDLANPR